MLVIVVEHGEYGQEWERDKRHGKGTFWVKEGGKLRKQYAGDWRGEAGLSRASGVHVRHVNKGTGLYITNIFF